MRGVRGATKDKQIGSAGCRVWRVAQCEQSTQSLCSSVSDKY